MFGTTVTVSEALCLKIPDDLGFNEASTMFFPYMTAIHSLMDVGSLKKGQVCNSPEILMVVECSR